ncbi:MAG TPA: PAS domain S-box protein [Candidatus Limnocylindrales bacterium]|nr:PAS domain S-box protein [Candidatus Limnocylindrales bacterium]
MSPNSLHEGHQAGSSPSSEQMEKLVEVISRSQHSYRELIDNLDQAVFTLSASGEIRVANLRLAQILGVSFPDLIGRPFTDFLDSPTAADFQRAVAAIIQIKDWHGTVPAQLRGERQLRHFSCWVQPIVEDGKLTSIIGWARDITSELESEVRFSELFEALREGIFFSTPEGAVLDANPALVRMLGYDSKEELQRKNFRELYENPSDRDAVVRELEEKGSVQDRELVFLRKNGTRIHCLGSGFAVRDAEGRVVRVQGTLVDVTERLEIQRRLRQEQEFVRRLVASFPDVIAVLDREGYYTYVSQRIQEVLGNPPLSYIGERLGSRAHPEDRAQLAADLRKVLTGEVPQIQVEFRTQKDDGSWRTLRASASPLYDDAGAISGVVASARDVTDSKRIEQQFTQNEKFTAMGQMLAGVAHELNNPLTAILGVGDLLRERAADDAARRHAEIVLRQARRAADIVQNLLAFSRPMTSGRTKIRLNDLLQQVLTLQKEELRSKSITVTLKAPENLPAIEGDPKLLTQAFLNLVTNAQQAISSAKSQGKLDISLVLEGQRVIAALSDDGVGIAPENIQKIFDPFFTTKRPGGGSGLGLPISLAVIKEHGGTIEVDSQKDAGATFRVSLPAFVEAPVAEPASPSRPAGRGASPLRNHSVLVVDDEESIREVVQEGLLARGVKVDCAVSAEEALSLTASHRYEFIVCDFNLPGLHGQQLFEQLRKGASGVTPRFVFMTGDLVDSTTIAEFREKGARILQKPFHVSALATLLADLLDPESVKK